MKEILLPGTKVHVKMGILNYIGYISEVVTDPKEYKGCSKENPVYIINDHCYSRSDFKHIKRKNK